jgi:type IV secretory pathway TraG/TraD family ATPase VirD4
MEQFLFSLIILITQLYLRILGVSSMFIFRLCKALFLGLFFGGFRALSSRDLLILGPGESLKPSVRYQELFDYSQTANRREVAALKRNHDVQTAGLWLGRQVLFRGSSVSASNQDVWLPSSFLHQHVLIVGPTGSGKTEMLMKSANRLMSAGNLVCVDAAGFLSDRLAPIAKTCGSKLVCWDIGVRKNRVVWNFLEELEKFGTPKEMRAIAEALYGNVDDGDKNACFWKRDIMWLTAILAIVAESRKQKLVMFNPSDLPSLVMDRDGVRALMAHMPHLDYQWGADLQSYFDLEDSRFGMDISFLLNKLSPFKDPDVKLICDGSSQIFLLQALNGKFKHTLVIGQSLADGKFGSALASVMISYVMNVMYRRMRNPDHAWTPTYLICDEAPRLKNLDYEELTAIGRNAKAGVMLMCQSLDQFAEKTRPALNNCRTQIFLQGVSHPTAEWLSKQLGEYQRRVVTTSVNQGLLGPTSMTNQQSTSYERVPVLGIREISDRPYKVLPSKRSALVRISSAESPTTKPFMTDYSSS